MGNQEERTWGMLCHLAAFSYFIGVPFGNIVGPLIVWLIFKDRSPFVDDQGRESLNFQISMTIYGIVLGVAAFIIGIATLGIALLAIAPIALIFVVVQIILVILAAVSAAAGTPYRYPLTIQFFPNP